MRQYPNTVRITISDEMQCQLKTLKRLNINPTKFMMIAIQKELDRVKTGKGLRYDYILNNFS